MRITRTKQLQEQILAEFPQAKTMKGRNNYPCLKHEKEFPEYTAEDCTHANSITHTCSPSSDLLYEFKRFLPPFLLLRCPLRIFLRLFFFT